MNKDINILTVDDNIRNLKILRMILEAENYNVFEAQDSDEVFSLIESYKFHVILLDIDLPKLNGLEICQKIKGDEKLQHIPVVFITGINDQETIVDAFNAGGADFITKPFIKDELLVRVKNQITQFQNHDESAKLEELNTIAKLADLYSHEVLNPLNIAVGFLSEMPDDTSSLELKREVREAHQKIEDFIREMNRINYVRKVE